MARDRRPVKRAARSGNAAVGGAVERLGDGERHAPRYRPGARVPRLSQPRGAAARHPVGARLFGAGRARGGLRSRPQLLDRPAARRGAARQRGVQRGGADQALSRRRERRYAVGDGEGIEQRGRGLAGAVGRYSVAERQAGAVLRALPGSLSARTAHHGGRWHRPDRTRAGHGLLGLRGELPTPHHRSRRGAGAAVREPAGPPVFHRVHFEQSDDPAPGLCQPRHSGDAEDRPWRDADGDRIFRPQRKRPAFRHLRRRSAAARRRAQGVHGAYRTGASDTTTRR